MDKIRDRSYKETCREIAKKVPGWLHIHVKNCARALMDSNKQLPSFITALDVPFKLLYVTGIDRLYQQNRISLMKHSPKLISVYHPPGKVMGVPVHIVIAYRSALLNGRHIVDVLRAVFRPDYVSEAQLGSFLWQDTDYGTCTEDILITSCFKVLKL